MVDGGRSYSEIVHQLVAVRSALDSVIQVIVDDLVEDCVVKADEIGTLDKTKFDLARGAIGRLKPKRMAEILDALRYVVRDDR